MMRTELHDGTIACPALSNFWQKMNGYLEKNLHLVYIALSPTSFPILCLHFYGTVAWEEETGGLLATLAVNKNVEIYYFFKLSLTL